MCNVLYNVIQLTTAYTCKRHICHSYFRNTSHNRAVL